MKQKIRFGPAGKPINFKGKAYQACTYLKEHQLEAYEYQSTYGIKITEKSAKELKKDATKNNILISMHAPYYINLSSQKEETIQKSIQRITQSVKTGEWMGAYRIVFHPGFYTKYTPPQAMNITKKAIKQTLTEIENQGIKNYNLAPETTGKKSQLGNLDEIIELCTTFEHVKPTIDFAHLHARDTGLFQQKQDFNKIFTKLEENLNINTLHCHFTSIEYTDKGEKKHHTLENPEYGPNVNWFLETLIENGWNATIICETPLIDQDALKMKQIYENLK